MRNDNSDDHKKLTTRIKCESGPEISRELNLPRRRTSKRGPDSQKPEKPAWNAARKFARAHPASPSLKRETFQFSKAPIQLAGIFWPARPGPQDKVEDPPGGAKPPPPWRVHIGQSSPCLAVARISEKQRDPDKKTSPSRWHNQPGRRKPSETQAPLLNNWGCWVRPTQRSVLG